MITKNAPLQAGLIAGIIYAMTTGQILASFGIAIIAVIFIALIQFSYRKVAKKLLVKSLQVMPSKESPKYDGMGNGYYIVELKVKRNWLSSLFMRLVSFEVFARVRFQWGEEKRNSFRCPADEISLGLDTPRRNFIVTHDTISKLVVVKSKDFVLSSLKETDFCGEELVGNYKLTILVYDNKEKAEVLELSCPLCIKKGEINKQP